MTAAVFATAVGIIAAAVAAYLGLLILVLRRQARRDRRAARDRRLPGAFRDPK